MNKLKNREIDAFVCDYVTGVSLMTQIDKDTGTDSCETVGFLPRGKKGWTEHNVAGIVKKRFQNMYTVFI